MAQYLPEMIMFAVTVLVATLFFIPVTKFARKTPLTNFYWAGFWTFLALITAFAGGSNTLMLAGVENQAVTAASLNAVMVSYMLFVVFAWFRLSGVALIGFAKKRLAG